MPARKQRMITQGFNRGFNGNDRLRVGKVAQGEPCRELVAKAGPEAGFVPGIPQRRPLYLAVRGAVKKDNARIWKVIVGVDRTASVQFVHDGRFDFPGFDKVVAGYRPVSRAWNSVLGGQFFKRPAPAGWIPVWRENQSRPGRAEAFGQNVAGGLKIPAAKVHLQVNRACAARADFVVEPLVAGDNDIVTVAPGAEADAFLPDFEAVPAEQFPQGNAAHLVGGLLSRGAHVTSQCCGRSRIPVRPRRLAGRR